MTRVRLLLLMLLLAALPIEAAVVTSQTVTSRASNIACLTGMESVWYNTLTDTFWRCRNGVAEETTGGGGGGSSIILDIGNNGSNESTALSKIVTTVDINGIFSESPPDTLRINASIPWSRADALTTNGTNCPTDQFPLGVDASGNAEGCTLITTITSIAGTTNQINVSSPTGPVTLSIPNNPVLAGTVTAGGFSGPLTGNATTATALATDGANCSAGNAPLGVSNMGVAQGCFPVASQADFDAHLNDTTNAHAATAIGFTPTGAIASGTVAAALAEISGESVHQGGTSWCAENEINKTISGLWACTPDASGGAGGTPGGANTQVQFNDAGAFGGDAGLTYNKTTDILTSAGGFVGPLAYSNLTSIPSTLVKTDQGNTYTAGIQDFSAAISFGLPNFPGHSPIFSSRIGYDSTANKFKGGVNGITKTFAFEDGNVATATALAADGANCSAGQFPLGVSTLGAAQSCTALPTTITGTAGQVSVSASTGPVVISIPTSPTLPGTVTAGGFSGPLTGNASTATALSANATTTLATTANITLSGEQTVDGVLTSGTRVLVKNQTAPEENGILVTGSGAWVRATDYDTAAEFPLNGQMRILVLSGGQAGTVWQLTNVSTITLGTTPLGFVQTGGPANGAASVIGLRSLGTGATQAAAGNDDRLASMVTPSPLAAASQVTCTKPTMYVTGSGGPVTLTNAKWLADGTFAGQQCKLHNPSGTNTLTGPTTATIINCGNTGSVVIGLDDETPSYTWTGALWQPNGCMSLQRVTNSGPKLIDGLTLAAPLQLRNGTSGFNVGVDAGEPFLEGTCGGSPCDSKIKLPAGKVHRVQNSSSVDLFTVAEATGNVAVVGMRERAVWDSDAMIPDGTFCTYSDTQTVNSGPIDNFIICTENASQKISLKKYILPTNFTGSSLAFVLRAIDVDTSSHVLAFNIEAMCRTPGTDVVNNTWSTGVAISVAMTTANIEYKSSEVTVTPNGSCQPDDLLFVRLIANTGTNTDDGDARLIGVVAYFVVSELSK